MAAENIRCSWARSPAMIAYHDKEWGRPVRDDRTLFEFLVLEGVQAGLSWETVLARRERYREAFANFEISRVAAFDDADLERLMNDAGIIRNRRKIASAIDNAKAAVAIVNEFGSLHKYFWGYVNGKPLVRYPPESASLLDSTPIATEIANDLRKRGFRFVGPTMIYAFLQAVGIVQDHAATCFLAKSPRKADLTPGVVLA